MEKMEIQQREPLYSPYQQPALPTQPTMLEDQQFTYPWFWQYPSYGQYPWYGRRPRWGRHPWWGHQPWWYGSGSYPWYGTPIPYSETNEGAETEDEDDVMTEQFGFGYPWFGYPGFGYPWFGFYPWWRRRFWW
ncbi:hypothetical protein TEPIDINF_000568 [Tepidibacillus infernus]|uniref:Uncharacterized protein n=1 Tax=Tepidibacillus decaturensis TaxID=1413211 RepID=A0A135L2T9_9BACI|nr:hypothetical protein [Tepidibacillus decaturensis]KXG43219.1 hypothetical protein U473_03710 [Tepidibacillus decaturensis]